MADSNDIIKELSNNDRISHLPDDVIRHILSYLTIVDAVATCILSRRWNGLWRHVSKHLFFHHRCTTWNNHVTGATLSHNPLNLEKFSVRHVECSMMHDLIRHSIIKGFQYLDLFVKDGPIICLPTNLFTCQALEFLRLGGESILITVPSFVSLPNLRKMELVKVKYHGGKFPPMLITSCVNLEVLVVEQTKPGEVDIFNISSSTLRKIFVSYVEVIYRKPLLFYSNEKKISINAPALQYLSLRDGSGSVYCNLENLPYLEEANIDMNLSWDGRNDCFSCLASIYQAIQHVKVLTINELTFDRQVPDNLFPIFHMLTVLKMTIPCWGWDMLAKFLKNSPKLENLQFTIVCPLFIHNHDLDWMDPESVPSCLLSSLKSISIFSSTFYINEVAMATYLLKNGRILRTMKIHDLECQGSEKVQKFHNVLLSVPRGSDNCAVSIF